MKSLKNSPRLSAFYSKDKGKTSALIYSTQKLITATKNCLTGMIFAFLRKLPPSKYSLLLLKDDRADHHTSKPKTLYAQEGASFLGNASGLALHEWYCATQLQLSHETLRTLLSALGLLSVVKKVDNTIRWKCFYPGDNVVSFPSTNPLGSTRRETWHGF